MYGALTPASVALEANALPIGLSSGARVRGKVAAGCVVTLADIDLDDHAADLLRLRSLEIA